MKIRSLSHVGLTVSNFNNAVKWYYDNFGLKLISEQILEEKQVNKLFDLYKIKDAKIKLGFLRTPKGGVVEIFEFSKKVPKEHVVWNKPGPTHLTFDVRNIQKWYKRLSQKGIYFFSEPQKTGTTEWVFLRDPDGNLIELIDLKMNYHVIRKLGALVCNIFKKTSFKKYYQ